MLNINFVPDDYIQSSESHRANLMYLVLLAVVMAALGGSFMTIRLRQRALNAKEQVVNTKIMKAQEAIKQFEELQAKRQMMMKTALMTAELLEPVPRSVLLASLTNSLPQGTSLLEVKLIQKEVKSLPGSRQAGAAAANRYQARQTKIAAGQLTASQQDGQIQLTALMNPGESVETHIDIEGIAISDLQVASYIEQLASSSLMDNVALVESKEHNYDKAGATFRRFKLTAKLKKSVHLSKEDIEKIRSKGKNENAVFRM